MKWYKSHTDLAGHPKRFVFERELGVQHGLHYIHLWFTHVAKYYENGDVTNMIPAQVALACEWQGESNALISALSVAGFIDKIKGGDGGFRLIAHDWNEEHSRFISENQRRKPTGNPRKTQGLPSLEENRIEEKRIDSYTQAVEDCYKAYPSSALRGGQKVPTGKTKKLKAKIKKILDTGYPLLKAIQGYVDTCEKTGVYLKNFSTFLNNLPDLEAEKVDSPKTCQHNQRVLLVKSPTGRIFQCSDCGYKWEQKL